MKIEKEIISGTEQVKLSNGAVINRYSHVLAGAEIGDNCMIGEHVYVASTAKIGNRTRVQNGNNIWDGVELGEDVFIGPSVVITNDHDPGNRFQEKQFKPDRIIIGDRATICAGVGIVAPCMIQADAHIGLMSIVLRNVGDGERVKGIVK